MTNEGGEIAWLLPYTRHKRLTTVLSGYLAVLSSCLSHTRKYCVTPCRFFRWQETDYRDFRINFIQFMRTPPVDVVSDGPEMVPVEIVAESKSAAEKEQKTPDDVQQPVVLDAVVYEDAARAMEEKLRAWPVQEEEAEEAPLVSANSGSEQALSAAAAAAGAATAAVVVSVAASANAKHSESSSSLSDVDTSPPTPPTEQVTPTGSDGDESDEYVETAGVGTACSASPEPPPPPTPLPSSTAMSPSSSPCGDSSGGEESEDGATAAPDPTDGGCWDDEAMAAAHQRGSTGAISEKDGGSCSLGWSPIDEGNDADEEMDDDGNTIRSRRAFSNLETARRGGAGLTAIVADSMSDGDQYGDRADSGSSSGSDTEERRPRALSLDGWFTCGLENGLDTKSYETHDHAGRLRDLVKLVSTVSMIIPCAFRSGVVFGL